VSLSLLPGRGQRRRRHAGRGAADVDRSPQARLGAGPGRKDPAEARPRGGRAAAGMLAGPPAARSGRPGLSGSHPRTSGTRLRARSVSCRAAARGTFSSRGQEIYPGQARPVGLTAPGGSDPSSRALTGRVNHSMPPCAAALQDPQEHNGDAAGQGSLPGRHAGPGTRRVDDFFPADSGWYDDQALGRSVGRAFGLLRPLPRTRLLPDLTADGFCPGSA